MNEEVESNICDVIYNAFSFKTNCYLEIETKRYVLWLLSLLSTYLVCIALENAFPHFIADFL